MMMDYEIMIMETNRNALTEGRTDQQFNALNSQELNMHRVSTCLQRGPNKRGHRLMTTIVTNLNRITFFSLEDSLVNLQLNGY